MSLFFDLLGFAMIPLKRLIVELNYRQKLKKINQDPLLYPVLIGHIEFEYAVAKAFL